MMKLVFSAVLIIGSVFAEAKKFETTYVSFDLLNNWHCHPDGTEWVCRSKLNRKKASEAMIILTAKQKGPLDSLAQYIKYLKAPRRIKTAKGGSWTSKVFHAKQRQINKHMWVDGFHQGSEVPVYYTRYLVTVKGGLAVLVTYSAHKNHYKKYAADFATSINSLRLKNVSSLSLGKGGSMGMGGMQDHLQDMINADSELGGLGTSEEAGEAEGLGELLNSPEALVGLGGAGSALGYLLYKRRKRRQQRLPLEEESRDKRSRHRQRRHRRSSSGSRRSSSRSSSSSRRRHR